MKLLSIHSSILCSIGLFFIPWVACSAVADWPLPAPSPSDESEKTSNSPDVLVSSVEIVRGVPDRGRDPAVVALRIGTTSLCSGTLIAPNAVLTARHCVSLTDSHVRCPSATRQIRGNRTASSIRVYAGEHVSSLEHVATGERIITPPGDSICNADIAVVVLDRNVDSVEPLSIRRDGVARGDFVRAVGYGVQGDESIESGIKLVREHVPVLESTKAEFFVGEATCFGDSGGPAIDKETNEIVGVVSRGGPTCEGIYVHNVYTRADAFDTLISSALDAAAEQIERPKPKPRRKPVGVSPPVVGGNAPPVAPSVAPSGTPPATPVIAPATAPGPPQREPRKPARRRVPKPPVSNLGAACTQGKDCASGVCITERNRQYCSRSCATGDRCPSLYRCTTTREGKGVCTAY